MPSKKTAMRVYLEENEHNLIRKNAKKARLSTSTYAKRLCLGYTIKSTVEQEAVLALIRLNADIGRLGGLLKKALKDGELARTSTVTKLINEIANNKSEIMEKVRELGK